ncbi:MAG: TGS domain-containing protein, partial [Mycoplasmatales bacterium]
MIQITFPDGNKKDYEQNITLREIASEISTSLAKSCVCGKVNGEYYDMNNPITVDANIILVTD